MGDRIDSQFKPLPRFQYPNRKLQQQQLNATMPNQTRLSKTAGLLAAYQEPVHALATLLQRHHKTK
ncbi:hypothetical protein PIB30_060912 [Stylosanthes scabra]|uniref:Uncharacterized protein n=1 Tax=Stylosanthes scabra TaxID=79078 RepID=A0ABU6ZJF2_9FABA|nr:hypothetical protein [Stylosanthes scabra]